MCLSIALLGDTHTDHNGALLSPVTNVSAIPLSRTLVTSPEASQAQHDASNDLESSFDIADESCVVASFNLDEVNAIQ